MRLASLYNAFRENLDVVILVGYAVVCIGGVALYGIDTGGPYVFGYVAAIWVLVGVLRIWERLRLRRAIRILRRFDVAGRQEALRGV